MKFEDCQRGREVGFVTNDPNFGVRPNGTVYTEQDVSNLSEPVQFMVTAMELHDPRVWETTVKLALAGHPHPLALSKVPSHLTRTDVWGGDRRGRLLVSRIYAFQSFSLQVLPNSIRFCRNWQKLLENITKKS